MKGIQLTFSILAIDPGRSKCGVAIVSREEGILARTIVGTVDLPDTVRLLVARFEPQAVVIGAGTGSKDVIAALGSLPVPIHLVDERLSTQKARARFFKDNPPSGWRRLIPKGLLSPSCPYDDYAAVLLAEQYLRSQEFRKPMVKR